MNKSVINRLEAIERRYSDSEPRMIIISYDAQNGVWSVQEDNKRKILSRLQDYVFNAHWQSHVILDTMESTDPAIHTELYSFNIEDFGCHRNFRITSIVSDGNGKSEVLTEWA